MRTRVGIVSFAHMHAHGYADVLNRIEEADFIGVADEDETRGREAAKSFGVEFLPLEELLERCEAVIVCSETRHHRRYATTALERGVDVLCEKPLATTVEDARAMISTAEESEKLLRTAFPVRYLSAVRRAKAAVESGAVGRVMAVSATNHGKLPDGWFLDPESSGGGAVMDHTVHVADVLRWMFDAEIESVYAEIGSFYSDGEIDDAAILTFELSNGVFATLDPSWSRGEAFPAWGDVKLEITGTEGVISVDAFDEATTIFDHETGNTARDYTGDDMDELLIRDFITEVQTGSAVSLASGTDGLRALEVALTAYESGRTGEPTKTHPTK